MNYLKTAMFLALSIFTTLLTISASIYSSEPGPAKETHSTSETHIDSRRLTLITYNVAAFRHKPDIDSSYVKIAALLKKIHADVVCLNEVDSLVNRTGKTDQVKKLAQLMGNGWNNVFGGAMDYDGGRYGVGIICKSKINNIRKVPLPQGNGSEPRVLVVIETEEYIVGTTHLDFKTESSQLKQTEIVCDFMKKYADSGKPVFLCGDMNASPDSRTLEYFLGEDWIIISSTLPTFPSENPEVCIDYILLLNNGYRYKIDDLTGDIMKTEDIAGLSDHLPVAVTLHLWE